VLLVDDDADIRLIAEIALARIGGLAVSTAASTAEARVALAERRPDAVLLDVELPDLDGPAFAAELAAGPYADIPIVFLSGYPMEDERRAPSIAGAILKPFDPLTLAAEIKELLVWT